MNKVKIKDLAPQLLSKAEQVKQIRPRRIAWVVVAALALTLAQPTVALAALAWSHYYVRGPAYERYERAAPLTAHFESVDIGGRSVVEINTRFGGRPMADVQVHCSSVLHGTRSATGYAQVIYYAGVRTGTWGGSGSTGPPNPPTEVPVRVTVRGHASWDDGGNAQARVHIANESFMTHPDFPNEFRKTVTLPAEIGIVYRVELEGIASAESHSPYNQPVCEAQAVADPLFEFDQDAFDAQRAEEGLPTFTLADYYEFQFSPNMLAGDLDGDDDVDLVDFSILARQWRQAPGEPSADIAPPEEPDGIVDFLDLGVFCAYWLEGK